jgi:sporulation protein YlmC with PRC-barrel domain
MKVLLKNIRSMQKAKMSKKVKQDIILADISEIQFDDKNANKGNVQGNRLIEKSIQQNGFGRAILLDKNNNIIAGNKTTEKAGEVGLNKVRIIETDGTEIIAVKRTDIDINSKKGRALAIADNQTAKAGIEFDIDRINELSEQWNVDFTKEWEINPIELESFNSVNKEKEIEELENENECPKCHYKW